MKDLTGMIKLTIDGLDFELVEFVSHDKYPETEGCYFLRPAKTNPDLTKMTKTQLIEYIEALNEDN